MRLAPPLLALITLLVLGSFAGGQSVAVSESAVPQRYTTTSLSTDYAGGDYQNIFDISLVRCHAACLADDEFMARFKQAPAAVTNHHAFPGGLLRHTVDLIELVHLVAPRYPQPSRAQQADLCPHLGLRAFRPRAGCGRRFLLGEDRSRR